MCEIDLTTVFSVSLDDKGLLPGDDVEVYCQLWKTLLKMVLK